MGLLINRIEMQCPQCGTVTERKIETGYISGHDLGRPRGAKGSDTYSITYACPQHGVVIPNRIVIYNPPTPVDNYGNPLDGEENE